MTCSLLGCCSLQCVQPQSPRKRTPHDSCGAEWPIQLMSSGELKKEFKAVADAQLSDRRFLRQPIHPSHSPSFSLAESLVHVKYFPGLPGSSPFFGKNPCKMTGIRHHAAFRLARRQITQPHDLERLKAWALWAQCCNRRSTMALGAIPLSAI